MRIELDMYLNVDIIVYCEATMIGEKPCTAPSYHRDILEADSKCVFWSCMSGSVKS
jgi:hypothetical protein